MRAVLYSQDKFPSAFNAMLTSLEASLDGVHTSASSMMMRTEVDKLASEDSLCRVFSRKARLEEESPAHAEEEDSALDALQQDVAKWIDSSHQYSLWEMQNAIRSKTAYLKGLRL